MKELLGPQPSVRELATVIADRAAGNAFFAEEMVRELLQRGVLTGRLGGYACCTNVAEVRVPATVQAAIAARIDRLSAGAELTLHAASVIGARFEADLLAALEIEPAFDELLAVDLINQVRFAPSSEFAFHHPLIRAVAYESQLKSDRARWHRRLAAAIQDRAPGSVDDNAALIASHLQAAGDDRAAYAWHMRAGAWAAVRDIDAARRSWERARQIADAPPADNLSMRIAPRTMLYVTDGLGTALGDDAGRFAELRELCSAAGDKLSLAIAMSGRIVELLYSGHSPEGSQMASEQMVLLESIGDPTPLMGLAFIAFCNWFDAGDYDEIMRWSQTVIDLAAGDPEKGAGFGMGSPLAAALAYRGTARLWLGLSGWRRDIDDAFAMAQSSSPDTLAAIAAWTHGSAILCRVVTVDDSTLRILEEVVEQSEDGNPVSVALAVFTLGLALLGRDAAGDRRRGLSTMEQARAMMVHERAVFMIPVADVFLARERAKCGVAESVSEMREAVGVLQHARRLGYGIWATALFAETLLECGFEKDVHEAEKAIDWLACSPIAGSSAMLELLLLRLRALSARVSGDTRAYRDEVCRYRALAQSLDYEWHIASAAAMADDGQSP